MVSLRETQFLLLANTDNSSHLQVWLWAWGMWRAENQARLCAKLRDMVPHTVKVIGGKVERKEGFLKTHRSIQCPIWALAQEPGCLDPQNLNHPWLQGLQLQETCEEQMVNDSESLCLRPSLLDPGVQLPALGPTSALTFRAPAGSRHHCAISPDLQVGFCFPGVICVEVPLPDLASELEEGAGVRDGVCLAALQQQDSQHGDPQPQVLEPGLVPAHQWLTSLSKVWALGFEELKGLDSVSDPGCLGEPVTGLLNASVLLHLDS